MSVVVRMEMPNWCWDCPCVNGEYGYCQADAEERTIEVPDGRPSWCPIICSLPEGHGRLVDGDKLMGEMKNRKWMIGRASDPDCLVFDAPTIVPAAESPSPKPTDPLPIRGVEYVPTEVDVQTGTVTYEPRERIEP